MSAARRYRLAGWLIRALIPVGVIGTYVLWTRDRPFYIGRSDTDLRRRLTQHAAIYRDAYFSYDLHWDAREAFAVECSLFHAMAGSLANLVHPAQPHHKPATCPFCRDEWTHDRSHRLTTLSYRHLTQPTARDAEIAPPADKEN